MQVRLEDCLKAAENEVPARCCVYDEGEVVGEEVFGESVSFDSGEGCQAADCSMGVRVDELKQVASQRLGLLLRGMGDFDVLQQR